MPLLLKLVLFGSLCLGARALTLPPERILDEISFATFLEATTTALKDEELAAAGIKIKGTPDPDKFPIELQIGGRFIANLNSFPFENKASITITNRKMPGFQNHEFYSIVKVNTEDLDFKLEKQIAGQLQTFKRSFASKLDFIASYPSAKEIAQEIMKLVPKTMEGVAVSEAMLIPGEEAVKRSDSVLGEYSFQQLSYDVGPIRRAIEADITAYPLHFTVKMRLMMNKIDFESHPEQPFLFDKLKAELENFANSYNWALLNDPQLIANVIERGEFGCSKFSILTEKYAVPQSLSADGAAPQPHQAMLDAFYGHNHARPFIIKANLSDRQQNKACLLDESLFFFTILNFEPFYYLHVKYVFDIKQYTVDSILAITPNRDLEERLADFVASIKTYLTQSPSAGGNSGSDDTLSEFLTADLVGMIKGTNDSGVDCVETVVDVKETNFSFNCLMNDKPIIKVDVVKRGNKVSEQTISFLQVRQIKTIGDLQASQNKKIEDMQLNEQKTIPGMVTNDLKRKLKADLEKYKTELVKHGISQL